MDIFILGNGLSRKAFRVSKLQKYGMVIGCNALYRDGTPDILVAVDRPMIREIEESGYEGQVVAPGPDVKKPFKYSGYLAMQEAVRHNPSTVYLIGFDYDGNPSTSKLKRARKTGSNIYWGSKNYKTLPTPELFKQRQTIERKFIVDNPQTRFIRVINEYSSPVSLGCMNITIPALLSRLK